MLIGEPALVLLSVLHVLRAGCIVAYTAPQPDATSYIRKRQRPSFYLCAWIKVFSACKNWSEIGSTRHFETIHKNRRRTSGVPSGSCLTQMGKTVLLPAILTCMAAAASPQDSQAFRFDFASKQPRVAPYLNASITNTIGDFVGIYQVVSVNVKRSKRIG